jgi:hypothetical protein
MATERVKASVLHGEKDLRLVSTNTPRLLFRKQGLIRDIGRARTSQAFQQRSPGCCPVYRPMRLRSSLLQPLPQRRHHRS